LKGTPERVPPGGESNVSLPWQILLSEEKIVDGFLPAWILHPEPLANPDYRRKGC
jgi:hypothetical protein